MELIDKNLLRQMICNLHCGLSEDNRLYIPLNEALRCIDSISILDPVKHGRWIINTDDFTPAFRCTCCGYNKPMIAGEGANNDPGRYCQNCGAKMEGVDGK